MTSDTQPTDPGDHTADAQKAAFLLMLKRSEKVLRKVVCMFCEHEDDRRELNQEIMYKLWSGFAGFRHESRDTTWVYSVARQTALMRYRDRRDWIEFTDRIPEVNHPFATDDIKHVNESLDLEQAREADKEILLLVQQGYEYEEVSIMLNIEVSTLRNRVQRLRERLEGKL